MIFLYIDPGAGSMMIQAILAALLAVPFFFRSQVARVATLFRNRHRTRDEATRHD